MKRRIIITILIVIVIGAALVWFFCCKRVGYGLAEQQQRADNDPCVKKALDNFTAQLKPLLLSDFKNPADEVMTTPQKTHKGFENPFKEVIHSIRKADFQRQELSCQGNYLPFKIDHGNIQYYPGDNPPCPSPTPTPSPSPSPFPSPTPPPASIKNNSPLILEMAKSVGRLGIRRTGSDAYPSFWGTGFLVAPDVIMTSCHVMDPIMKVEQGEQHLHLDGEELFINFKWQKLINTEEYDYDYQCPIIDVLGCSSRPGVDVALLYFDNTKCAPKNPLPDPLILDTNPPHQTSPLSREKVNACATGNGQNCVAMIAYADIDHPIDAPTNDVYKVYQDNTYGDFQFVMNDDIATVAECDKGPEIPVKIMMEVGTTTVGESGGVLTYLDTPVNNKLIVSGMHTCCSAFFKYTENEMPPAPKTACARLSRTLDNQAISTWSVVQDHKLCTILKNHKAVFYPDVDCN